MIEGMDRLIVKLNKIGDNTGLMNGLEKACIRVEADAKEKCPVDDGILQASITHYVSPSLEAGFAGTNVEYGPYVEFGTGIFAVSGMGRKTRWSYMDAKGEWHSTVGQKPNPFLYPALAKNKDKIQQDIVNEQNKYLRSLGR